MPRFCVFNAERFLISGERADLSVTLALKAVKIFL